jgi:serine protease Do
LKPICQSSAREGRRAAGFFPAGVNPAARQSLLAVFAVSIVTALILATPGTRGAPPETPSSSSLAAVVEQVNRRMVKLFGAGGLAGIHAYGTGVLISADGYVLTAASPLLDTSDLLVHLYDGRRYTARVLIAEPALDAALVKIDKAEDLPCFDIAKAAKEPLVQPGDSILAFSNEFQIATREEALSVQHGVIASYGKLHGRRGIFEAPYTGDVYVLDAITNNPGAAGGAVTTRKGELLGIIGKELRNTLSDTWINYAVPVGSLADFVEKAKRGEYKLVVKNKPAAGPGVYHGIILVPDVVERTPPYVEDTMPQSPAARAGLRPDDLIVYVDGEKVVSIKEFRDMVERARRPGTVVKLEIRRGEKLLTVDLKLESPPSKQK